MDIMNGIIIAPKRSFSLAITPASTDQNIVVKMKNIPISVIRRTQSSQMNQIIVSRITCAM